MAAVEMEFTSGRYGKGERHISPPPPKGEIPTKSITWNKLRVINHKPEMETLSVENPLSKLLNIFP